MIEERRQGMQDRRHERSERDSVLDQREAFQCEVNAGLARGNFLAERRSMIILVLAAFLFTVGFALTGREERRVNELTRDVCIKQVDALHAVQALRPIVSQALLVKRNTTGLQETERYFLRITGGKSFQPVDCSR